MKLAKISRIGFVMLLGACAQEPKKAVSTDRIDFDRYSHSRSDKPESLDPNGALPERWGILGTNDQAIKPGYRGEDLNNPYMAEVALPYILYANIRNIVNTGNVEGKDLTKIQKRELLGTCLYQSNDNSTIATPCLRAQVLLKEEKNGEPVGSTWTNQEGRFRFSIPADKKYFVTVKDSKGRTSELPMQVGGGQFVSLGLRP